ncbi:MAG: hypothetical protein HQ553_15415 [Chloroflexi bacterium]|nr:hypothetical protein [Chloroflexota bacterium]
MNIIKEEAGGTTLIFALLLVCFGGLMVPPIMDFVDNGIDACQMYEEKTDEIYAADSGIEDALWRVKYGDLEEMFPDPAYDMYDYYTSFDYTMDNQINDCTVDVSIENKWIPKDITAPNKTDARTIIETGKLIVTGNIPNTSSYQIRITYYPDAGDSELKVDSIGIWLPTGFTYVDGSSNLEELTVPLNEYYSIPSVSPHCGGEAVVWDFSSVPFATLPGANPLDTPIIADVTFNFNSTQAGVNPTAMAWVETSGVSGIEFSWDADIKIFGITSIAGGATAEAHLAKIGLRDLGSSIEGDYRAIGGTLMRDVNGDANGIRDVLDAESSATVNDISSDAAVVGAFLYWTGWFGSTIFEEDCKNMSMWMTSGNYWKPKSGSFRGHPTGSSEVEKLLTLKKNDPHQVDLSGYTEGDVILTWEQTESGALEGNDSLEFELSGDDGATWSGKILAFVDDNPVEDFEYTIPQAYLTSDFTMRFYLKGFTDVGEYCYIDNIIIAEGGSTLESDESVIFEINNEQVYLDAAGDPQKGAQEITASAESCLLNEQGYSYACFLDVTKLVQAYSNVGDGTNHTGNGTYTVGGVDGDTGNSWSYAGWSLVIVYASAETEGHQLFIYDEFVYAAESSNVDFDNDGADGGTITGFLVPDQIPGEIDAAKLTCFVGEGDDCWNGDSLELNGTALSNADSPVNNVWNSQSPGLAADGVDIDTFDVTWASGLITAGDSSAQLDLDTGVDSWNLVYIILSVRSEVVTGGAMDYMLDF